MRPGGRYVTPVTPMPHLLDEFGLVSGLVRSGLYRRRAAREAARRDIEYRWVLFRPSAAKLDQLADAVRQGLLSPPPLRLYGFEELAVAHAAAAQAPRLGKVVMQMPS
ncbi:MAG: zinc-binding dehydrogenase [Nevskia sp.]|nr:zinc-binding dehydrogenase [Nevskia sp.]